MSAPPPVPTRLFRLLLLLGARLQVRMDQRLAAVGLTTQQAAVLTVVEQAAAAPTLGDVARTLSCSHQNARQLADVLRRKGLLRIEVDPSDRRARRLHLTPGVRGLFGPRDAADHEEVARWMSALTEEEQSQACEWLARLLGSLEPERATGP